MGQLLLSGINQVFRINTLTGIFLYPVQNKQFQVKIIGLDVVYNFCSVHFLHKKIGKGFIAIDGG